jgi:type II secretion system protein N
VNERLLRYAKYAPLVGYPLFYLVCLAVFAAMTFPYDKLKQRVVAQYNESQRGMAAPQELQIDEMSGSWVTGVRVRGARLISPPPPAEPDKGPSKIEIDEATVRFSVLSALVGNSSIGFDVLAFGGEASGTYDEHGKGDKDIDLTLDSIDIGQVQPLVQVLGVPLQGHLGGTVKLSLPEGKPSKGAGSIALEATSVGVGDGKAKLKGALALPKVDVGTLSFAADAKDGALKITKLAASGKDLELQGEGRITMRDNFGDALCDAQVRFKLNDAYRNKSDITKTLFGAPGSTSGALFELDPKVKQSKRADGFYGWTLRGTVSRLDFMPAGGAGGASPGSPAPSAPGILPKGIQ